MRLGPRFWYRHHDRPPVKLAQADPERLARISADWRQMGVWAVGQLLHDASRVERIAAAQDWATLMSPTLCRYPMPERRSA